MLCKLGLGDWSGDGHGITKDVVFDCNYDPEKIWEAYKESCKKLGIQFNNNEDYTGLGLGWEDSRAIWATYGDRNIHKSSFDILMDTGCFKGIEDGEDYEIDEDDDSCYIFEEDKCALLIMNFIALSMPKDFKYTLMDDEDIPEINQSSMIGYGLFD